jgi:gamma-glutamyltranspeptidase/glutathione hydrolase
MQTGRSVVYANNGGAAASQPLAVSAAISILKQGGSFIDAAIALSAVNCVVEPGASHLGGDAFLVTHHAATKSNLAFNGSGEAPHEATPAAYGKEIPLHGYKSGTVPGLVSTWFEAHARYGTLPMAKLLEHAIDYAENGFPANAGFINRMANHLALFPDTAIFKDLGFDVDVKIGDLIVQKELAQSLREIASSGRSAFYEGRIAQQLISGSNGWFSAEDLKTHTTRVLDPLSIKYRNLTIYGQPPPTQGMILMEELLINERFDLATMSETDRIHIGVESKKAGFADRNAILGDPEFIEVNVSKILSEENIDKRTAQISMEKAATDIAPVSEGSDTTYFLVADSDGNAVSWIQSVFHGFGSSWVIPGTGIILNNRLTGFSLDPASPNIVEPGKRPAHTLNAFTAVNPDGSLHLVGGTPGANIQVQTNLQLITNVVDLKMNVQEATEAPRWQHLNAPGQSSAEEMGGGVLEIENRVSSAVIDELRAKGHDVKLLAAWGHGSSVQLMQVLPNKTYAFGSDPRCEGHASGI